MAAYVLALPHYAIPPLYHQPIGTWGIAYDIFTRATEDDLPHGWNSRRCMGFVYIQWVLRLKFRSYYVQGIPSIANNLWIWSPSLQ
jgi:hypothetical protein